MIRSRDEAQGDMALHAPRIQQAITQALAQYMKEHGGLRHGYSARTEASIIHDLMVAHLRVQLDGVPGVAFHLKRNLFLVGVDGKYTIRAKKLDKKLQPKNIPTQQVLDFLNQAQLELPGAENPTNIHVGYQRNDDAELTKAAIWMTCTGGGVPGWSWPLSAEAGDFGMVEPVAPATPLPVTPVQPAVRVRPRVQLQEQQTEAEAGNDEAQHGRAE
jgi:hypothetical protein